MKNAESFDTALRLLPQRLRRELLFLPDTLRESAEEIRLRAGRPLCLTADNRPVPLASTVSVPEIRETLERAADYSLHTVHETLRRGFVTAPGGLRIGICGSVISENGVIAGFRSISSLCIRLPGELPRIDPKLFDTLRNGSVLIYAPPGAGKTTFLRELVRYRSASGKRVAAADERGELAALKDGVPRFDIGDNTDILEFAQKRTAAELLLRNMNPEVLAIDELSRDELPLLKQLSAAGADLLATIHARNREELIRRGIPTDAFSHLVQIRQEGRERIYTIEEGTVC